jgi:hypothetical protein
MEFFFEEVRIEKNLIIQVSIQEDTGCRVTITAKDDENRRIWKTAVMDTDGGVKVYENTQMALEDARKKIGVWPEKKAS